jgi:hypothetical protein
MRAIGGIAVALFAFLGPVAGAWQIIMYVVAAIAVVTAIMGLCPLYSVLGVNTCSAKR